ncbi:MAG TPA: hypothetical protein DCL73_16555 [Treponema sp.]|nr:hypothetical protein [Treponema sp.]
MSFYRILKGYYMSKTLYTSVLISKSGLPVPVFSDGHTMHSRYDPVREADKTASLMKDGSFFLVAGIGGAYLIQAVRRLHPESVILAAENSRKDIEFLKRIPSFLDISADKKIIIFPVENTARMLLRYYLPCVYGSLGIVEHQSWAAENVSGIVEFRKQVDEASRIISADFSVQAHFGRIWQRNICMNLKNYCPPVDISFPLNKTALIAAAGPSLDSTVSYITGNRDSLYVVATDTAFGSFVKRGIHFDAVVSIDGQEISHNHFMELDDTVSGTLFVFDLCANPAAVRAVRKRGCGILFVHTGHPLSQYASQYSERLGNGAFMQLDSGAGTVTIAAADFAAKAGFSNIAAAGADFSYLNGKSYMKGTYLDALYNTESCRIFPCETAFDRLLFRTQLIPYKDYAGRFTTAVLQSYDAAFENWADSNNLRKDERDFLKFCRTEHPESSPVSSAKSFDISSFTKQLKSDFSSVDFSSLLPGEFPPVLLSLIPAAASFRINAPEKDSNFEALANLAYSEILRYN